MVINDQSCQEWRNVGMERSGPHKGLDPSMYFGRPQNYNE